MHLSYAFNNNNNKRNSEMYLNRNEIMTKIGKHETQMTNEENMPQFSRYYCSGPLCIEMSFIFEISIY